MDMEDRLAVLEKEVVAIKSEIVVIRSAQFKREDGVELNARVARIELDLVVIKGDVAQLKGDVAQLKVEVAQLKVDVAQLKVEQLKAGVAQLKVEVALLKEAVVQLQKDVLAVRVELTALAARFDEALKYLATSAQVSQSEANIKGWMIVTFLSFLTITLGSNFALYSAMKSAPAVGPAQAQAAEARAGQASATPR